MEIINKYNEIPLITDRKISQLNCKQEDILRQISETEEFEKALIKCAIDHPLEALRLIFCYTKHSDKIITISEEDDEFLLDKELINETIEKKYSNIIYDILYNCFNNVEGFESHKSYILSEIEYLGGIKIDLVSIEEEESEWNYYKDVIINAIGKKAIKFLIEYIKDNGLKSIIHFNDLNSSIFSWYLYKTPEYFDTKQKIKIIKNNKTFKEYLIEKYGKETIETYQNETNSYDCDPIFGIDELSKFLYGDKYD